jgi:predicted aspartyl protease
MPGIYARHHRRNKQRLSRRPESNSSVRRALLLSVLLLSATCAAPRPFDGPFAVLPERAPIAVLAIRDPLGRPDLSVEGIVRGASGREARVWMVVDSGASVVSVPVATGRGLGLGDFARGEVQAASGRVIETFVMASSLTVGPLSATNVLVGLDAAPDPPILGQSILHHAPWEVSWDRGTLTLGATPWVEEADVQALPLAPSSAGTALEAVEVRIGGRPVRMLLDTGALVSSIPDQLGSTLGLSALSGAPQGYRGAAGPVTVSHVFAADLELGAIRIAKQRIFGERGSDQPLLGLDVLSRFNFQVLPGQKLLLRPRGDPRPSAAARIARWPWLSACAAPGCVRAASIVADGRNGRAQIDLEAALARPVKLLLACADPAGPTSGEPPATVAMLLEAGPLRGPMRHLVVQAGPTPAGTLRAEVALAGLLWFARDGSGCHQLAVMDVMPAASDEPPPPVPIASLRP